MKWMNSAGATTNYPTTGRGGVDATAANSSFADTKPWDDRICVMHGIYVTAGANAATVTITGHDGTADPLAVITLPANGVFETDFHGAQLRGLKVVQTGASCASTVFFEVGQTATY